MHQIPVYLVVENDAVVDPDAGRKLALATFSNACRASLHSLTDEVRRRSLAAS
jgi:hypothetical protein